MAWFRTDGAFPFYWWEATDEIETTYNGAFPVLGGPDTEKPDTSALGHNVDVVIHIVGEPLGHKFIIPPRQKLLRDISKIMRRRLGR